MSSEANKDRLFEEATTWFFRLQSGDLSEFERHAYENWLSESPAHRQSMTEVEGLLNAMQTPSKNIRDREQATLVPHVRKRRLFSPAFAKAASALMVCTALILYLQPALLQNFQSDYYTATGEQREIVLADGSHVLLNTDTAIKVYLQGNRRKIELLRGEAFFEVVHNQSQPFVVNADHVNTKDIGTAFSVSRLEDKVTVSVSEGVVETAIEPILEPVERLTKGQSAIYEANKLINLQSINTEQKLAWRDGKLVFIQATLDEIALQINRYRPGKLLIADPKLKQRRLTAVFYLNRLDDAINTLHRNFGISVRRVTNYLVLLG